VAKQDDKISIKVVNNGDLIPLTVQENIFLKDFTYNKKGGTGFGLYHAKKYLAKWAGDIHLSNSDKPNGTEFVINLPMSKIPDLDIDADCEVLIMENDEWERENITRFARTLAKEDKIKVFHQSQELDTYLKLKPKKYILLADNDVGKGFKTGLSYILDNQLQSNNYLVTNSYDDIRIVKKAVTNNLKIIPKILFNLK